MPLKVPLKVAVLASGRGSNLEALLEGAGEAYGVELVVSDRREARALAVAAGAGVRAVFADPKAHRGLADYNAALARLLEGEGIELVALAGYMRLVREELLRSFAGRIMNIHPSLLPAFPGADAQAQALVHGVKVSGCTVHFVDEGVDTGPIIGQRAVPVLEGDNAETLSARILEEEHVLYPRMVTLYALGKIVTIGRRVEVRT